MASYVNDILRKTSSVQGVLKTGTPTAGQLAGWTDADTVEGVLATNAHIASGAAIALSKLATDPIARANHTGTQLLSTISDRGSFASVTPSGTPDGTKFLRDDNTWIAPATGTVDVSGTPTTGQYARWVDADTLEGVAAPSGGDSVLADNPVTASRALALTDVGTMVRADHATVAVVLTVPANATVAFPIGNLIQITQWGAAAASVAPASGVTINNPTDKTRVIAARYGVIQLWKQATDIWLIYGALADA